MFKVEACSKLTNIGRESFFSVSLAYMSDLSMKLFFSRDGDNQEVYYVMWNPRFQIIHIMAPKVVACTTTSEDGIECKSSPIHDIHACMHKFYQLAWEYFITIS